MKKCPLCKNGTLSRKTKVMAYNYKGRKTNINQPGDFCNSCGDGILEGKDLKETRKQKHDFLAKVDGFLSSSQIRAIRLKLNLTQHEAAEIFGGGPNAFSRYERGESMQMKATDNLLRLLDKHPKLLSELTKKNAA
jgi:HTH-type transcriptional regulator/antitoxin MqsA